MSKFTIIPATPLDIPFLPAVHLATFNDELSKIMFPHSPAYEEWIKNNVMSGLANPSFCTLVAKENTTGRVVAYAKWQRPDPIGVPPHPSSNKLPTWPEGSKTELLNEWLLRLRPVKQKALGDRRHYYLHIIAVHPDYQGQGIGKEMLKWGIDQADEEGVEIYLDATPAGAPVYAKYGFLTVAELADTIVEGHVTTCMLRPPVVK